MPHGNSKKNYSYRRLLPSTQERLKESLKNKKATAKEALDAVYCSVGDVTNARSLGELPRGPQDIYNARYVAKKMDSQAEYNPEACKKAKDSLCLDSIWTLLERAKREEERSRESIFIRECTIHPDLFVVLANDRQLEEIGQFCTNPSEFSVLGIDPTFNIFDRNISLTVTTYRNLKLENKQTNKPPVFIGPLLMHQHKDWKTYSKFAHALTAESSVLEGVLACGTDGEKALIDGFKRNFRFSTFLRCFIHFKDNIKRELGERGFPAGEKQTFIDEIFGRQDGTVKYFGLVDCESEEEFDAKLGSLKDSWLERESTIACRKQMSFFEWFKKEKVSNPNISFHDENMRMKLFCAQSPKKKLMTDTSSFIIVFQKILVICLSLKSKNGNICLLHRIADVTQDIIRNVLRSAQGFFSSSPVPLVNL